MLSIVYDYFFTKYIDVKCKGCGNNITIKKKYYDINKNITCNTNCSMMVYTKSIKV